MNRVVPAALLVLFCACAVAQQLPEPPEGRIPGVVDIPAFHKQPIKLVEPQYPREARERWLEGIVVLDVVIDKTGAVEMLGVAGTSCCARVLIDTTPRFFVEAAKSAVSQWRWEPILVNGKATRIRTRVTVRFVLDETSPPIDVCNVLRDPVYFSERTVNLSGVVRRVDGLKLLSSSGCVGSVVVADDPDDSPPTKDEKYRQFEDATAGAKAVKVALRGEFQHRTGPGALAVDRLLVERVLSVTAPSK